MQNGFILNNFLQITKAMTMITLPALPHNALFTDIWRSLCICTATYHDSFLTFYHLRFFKHLSST